MNRVVIRNHGFTLELELMEGDRSVRLRLANHGNGLDLFAELDHMDMAALAVFVRAVTSRGDASSEQDTAAAEGEPT